MGTLARTFGDRESHMILLRLLSCKPACLVLRLLIAQYVLSSHSKCINSRLALGCMHAVPAQATLIACGGAKAVASFDDGHTAMLIPIEDLLACQGRELGQDRASHKAAGIGGSYV